MGLFVDMAGHAATALLRSHGDACTLPTGKATGLFDPVGTRPAPWGPEVGLGLRLSDQPSPYILLRETDVNALAEQDVVAVRELNYRVTRIEPAEHGMVMVRLAPYGTGGSAGQRWR